MPRILLSLLSIFLFLSSSYAQPSFIGIWEGELHLGASSLTLVLNISHDEMGIHCTLDSPNQQAKGIPAELETADSLSISIAIPSLSASYECIISGDIMTGTFKQSGLELPLSFKKSSVADNQVRSQTPVPPFPYTEEEVQFTNSTAGVTLCGTLTIPKNKQADLPAIILVSGSGLQDRNESIFGHQPFLVIADYLARHGIATLRYDDRGYGQSSHIDVGNSTTRDFLGDAAAGIQYLKEKGNFSRIGILGHSEGANIAIMLGGEKKVDFVISMAAIGVRGDSALTAQANRIMELQKVATRYTVSQYRSIVSNQESIWLKWFLDYDPISDIKTCYCPTFALNGDKDVQVISSLNLKSIETYLPKNSYNVIKEYNSLNHLFQHCSSGDVSEYQIIDETISTEVLNDIVNWLNNILR